MAQDVLNKSPFEWTPQRSQAAVLLAQGFTINETAKEIGVNEKTIDRWKEDIEFSVEVDRLTLMLDVAGRAERLRIAKRQVRRLLRKKNPSRKDLLDWLKYAQSETDGIKLNLTAELATAVAKDGSPVAGSGPEGTDEKRPSGDES